MVIIILLLSATPIFRGSKEQQSYCKKGMRLLATPRTQVLSLPALGIFIMIFLCSILCLAIAAIGAWEEAGGSILLCLAFGLFILIAGFFTAYCMQKRHILYDEEQLLIGRPFHTYRRLAWRELARMEIKNQDAFNLYDRDGVRQISATANLVSYHDFYETAMRHVRPENAVRNGNAGSYQRKYSVTAGEGILRYRTGEYVTMLAVSLMGVAMAIVKGMTSEEGIGAILFSKEELGAKLFIAGLLIISVVCLIYTSLQKITYDRMRITFERFPKGAVMEKQFRKVFRNLWLNCRSGTARRRTAIQDNRAQLRRKAYQTTKWNLRCIFLHRHVPYVILKQISSDTLCNGLRWIYIIKSREGIP